MTQSGFSQIGNQFVQAILCSPLHGLLSRNFVVLTVKGRKSGKAYSTPVNYQRQGNVLHIVSFRNRTWWRNLRGGSPLTVRLQGHAVKAWGSVAESEDSVAVKLSKICNDLRLLSSGPRAGLNEINLPPMATGSSIMPGKVNPIIPEVVNQVAYQVIGNDITVTLAAEAGQLELNVMEPVIAYNLFTSIDLLGRACRTFVERCIRGITANRERTRKMVENSIGLVTTLNPFLGYEKSTEIVHEALASGRSVYDIVLEKGYLTKKQLDDILSPEKMIRLRDLTSLPR